MGDFHRREFLRGSLAIAGVGLMASCGIPFGPAASPARLRQIGFLAAGSPESAILNLAAFRQGLSELGYVEGRDIV
ncbi:MAG: hypothetical protein ACKVVP_00155, partial [Chloroflexota bacterium]